ncbi:MAG: hypothetical protein ABI615_02205 [Chthoniobacterales bacterium]
MKKLILILTCALTLSALAEDKTPAAPRGGQVLNIDGQKAEFFVEPDRTVTIAFYDEAMKQVTPAGYAITATAEAPTGKSKLEFTQKGNLLASTAPFPTGDNYTVVLQIRSGTNGKPKNFRINFNTSICAECSKPEYACTCSH